MSLARATGVSVAANNFWDGGTKAEASVFGIDADGETASETRTSFTADSSGAVFHYEQQENLASGDDVIRNDIRWSVSSNPGIKFQIF